MTKKYLIVIGGLLAALLVVGVVGATAAYAQDQTPPAVGWMNGHGPGGGPGFNLSGAALDAAAKALGMTSDDLSAQLKSGKTLADIATAQGVDIKTVMEAIRAAHPFMLPSAELDAAAKALGMTSDDLSAALKSGKTLQQVATDQKVDIQTVQDAISAARKDQMRTQINQAVTDGKMSQDKANWLLEGLDKGFLDGQGFGFGFGGPRGGHGFGNGPMGQPTQQSWSISSISKT